MNRLVRAGAAASVLALAAGCGEQGRAPAAGEDGLVPSTPRALASVVVDHLQPAEPQRARGDWSDWGDPASIEAEVDYGADPEGTGGGATHTVRIQVTDIDGIAPRDRVWLRCRGREPELRDRCEEREVDGGRLVYSWYPGMEEEEGGSYTWMVVREDEVVRVTYEGSGLFDEDPRGLDLPLPSDGLREAALDPAMSLRTDAGTWEAGQDLEDYTGEEAPPQEPDVRPTRPRDLAAWFSDYLGLEPAAVRPSTLRAFGPHAVGAHLEFPAGRGYDAFSVDLLTIADRVPQLDRLPCPIARDGAPEPTEPCWAWSRNAFATWTLASEDAPGTLWVIGSQDDDKFNRVESVGVRVVSTGIDRPFFVGNGPTRVPPDLLAATEPFTADLRVGPEVATAR